MHSFPESFRALVIGAGGALGSAFVASLEADPRCGTVIGIGRSTTPPLDFDDEASVESAATALAARGPFHLIVNATGVLHTPDHPPEKRLAQLGYAQMEKTFKTNAFGPALVMAHFAPLLDRQRGVLAVLSARSAASRTTGSAAGTAIAHRRRRSTCC